MGWAGSDGKLRTSPEDTTRRWRRFAASVGLTSRLDKLYPGLSALERARLVLRAFKEDAEDPKEVRRSMPFDQVWEFNSYIGLMNAVNGDFGLYVSMLYLLVQELETRQAWMYCMRVWGLQASMAIDRLTYLTKEPITESEHRQEQEKARKRMAPVAELAEALADWHDLEGSRR